MVRTFLKVYMELGSYFLFLQEQIKDIIIYGKYLPKGIQRLAPIFCFCKNKDKTSSSNDDNPLTDGRGSRRRMRGQLDMVEREHDQGQGPWLDFVWKKDRFILGINAPHSICS